MGDDLKDPQSPSGSETTMDAGTTPETGAESSAAPEGEKKDLLSVVRDAVQADRDPASPAGGEDPDSQGGADEDNADPDDENFSDVPFQKHPRFRELVAQRNHFREGAQQFDQVQTYLRENGVTAEEAAEFITLRAAMKRDPAAAWEQMKPIVHQLLTDAGILLPADLAQRVQAGNLTNEAATEISRERAQRMALSRATEQQKTISEQTAQATTARNINLAVAKRESDLRRQDPDFDAKREDVMREILWLQRQKGAAKTPEDAVAVVNEAYTNVTKRTRAVATPHRTQSKKPVTGGRVSGSKPTTEAPQTMLDIVRRAG